MDYRSQQNNYPKAFLATGIILAIVIAICYFIVFKMPVKQEDGTGGILVNYGTVDEGMGSDYMSTEEPSVAEHANHTKPNKVTPAPPTEQPTPIDNSTKQVVTQNTEDAPVVSSDKKPSQTVQTQQQVTKAKPAPVVNQNALYKGKTNNGTGEGDGTDNVPGNQGVQAGSTMTPDYGQGGNGNGGTLAEMTNRKFLVKPDLVVKNVTVFGKVIIDIIADRDGNIIAAHAEKGAKVDLGIIQKCEEAAKKAKINRSDDAPDQQKGKIIFSFTIR